MITIGQQEGKPVMVKVWRDGEVARARNFTDEKDGEIVTKEIRGSKELVLQIPGCFTIKSTSHKLSGHLF